MTKSIAQTRREIVANDPPIEAGQIWRGYDNRGRILRSIRILGLYPDGEEALHSRAEPGNLWLYEDQGKGLLKTSVGYISVCPEFNLRYVFRLKKD